MDAYPILREIKPGHNMKIKYCTNYEEMSQLAFDSVVKDLKSHVLCPQFLDRVNEFDNGILAKAKQDCNEKRGIPGSGLSPGRKPAAAGGGGAHRSRLLSGA